MPMRWRERAGRRRRVWLGWNAKRCGMRWCIIPWVFITDPWYYNVEGLAGLHDRPKGHRPRRLSAAQEAALAAVILRRPDAERDGVCAWTRADPCRWLEAEFAKTHHPSSTTRVLRTPKRCNAS